MPWASSCIGRGKMLMGSLNPRNLRAELNPKNKTLGPIKSLSVWI